MGFVPKNIKKFEGTGDGSKCLVDDVLCEARVTGVPIHLGAMVSQHAKHGLVMNLNAQLAQYFPCFGDDSISQIIS